MENKKHRGFISRAGKRLQNMDQFGYPIHLTYKGNQDFKTRTGGCISLLIFIISLLYAGVRFLYMITRANPNISRYQIVRGYDSPEDRYFDPFSNSFFFVVRADFTNAQGKNTMMSPEYGTISFSSVSRINGVEKSQTYQMGPCTEL